MMQKFFPFGSARTLLRVLPYIFLALSPTLATAQTFSPPGIGEAQTGRPALPAELPTEEALIVFAPGTDQAQFALEFGLQRRYALQSVPNAYVFASASPQFAETLCRFLQGDQRVLSAYPNRRLFKTRHSFTPNDPYFFPNQPNGWSGPGQWHLVNSLQAGLDINVQGAWSRDLTGLGVLIGIVDDGVETAHPDLSPNLSLSDSFDFARNSADPNPFYGNDNHGTAVAGLAAARGGNAIGGTGVAPFAQIAALRCDFTAGTTAQFVDATLYRSVSALFRISIKNHSYGFNRPYIDDTPESAAVAASTAAGAIHVYSAGNNRGTEMEDANKQDTQNSPDVITVAALGSNGKFANYSNYGANVFVTAPSSSTGNFSLLTTDRTGDAGYNPISDAFPDTNYTTFFGGTSAAAPQVAGAFALAKQARPALTTRFAKHLLARTSVQIDPNDATETSDGGWRTNAAGFKFNQNYGFGLLNVDQLTRLATDYSGVTTLRAETVPTATADATIPDNDPNGVTRSFTIVANRPLEEMQVALKIEHTRRGDLEVLLTSPQGTTSRLVRASALDFGVDINNAANTGWTFVSNAFWGENPAGTWTLRVRDLIAGNAEGQWRSFSAVARMGTLVPANLRVVAGVVLLEGCVQPAQTLTFTFRPADGSTPFTRTATLGALGEFSLEDIPAGDYTLAVKGDRWLRKTVRADLRAAYVTGLSLVLSPGDVVENNIVDATDFTALRNAYNSRPGDSNWNQRADLNADGVVDSIDFALLRLNYGKQGDP